MLGLRSRQLIQVIQKIDSLCIDSTLPSLPKFVVVGDQSAGKSSIIEAICEITLPRGSGTCTRCPFQITTTAAKPGGSEWSCKVSLHRKHEFKLLGRKRSNPWVERDSLDPFHFATVTSKADLGDVLRHAQLALLNPTKDPYIYTNLVTAPKGKNEVEFSPNIVSLHIEAPELPELSFYDLPGAINVHEDGEAHLVGFVEELVKSYLKDPKSLILLACSADQDVENSTAFRFVGECKAKERTMGVLTKPDLAGPHRIPMIHRILKGEKFKLGAWFVTRQLSQKELEMTTSISNASARDLELEFFSEEPWSTTLAQYSYRFGIPNLQENIANELSAHIFRELPEIVSRVQSRLAEVNGELATFPEPPRSPAFTVISSIQALTSAVKNLVTGQGLGADNQFHTEWKELFEGLRTQLEKHRLQVFLGTPGYKPTPITVEDEGPSESEVETPSKTRKGNNGRAVPSTPRRPTTNGTPQPTRVKLEGTVNEVEPVKFTLGRIRRELNAGSTSGIPGSIDPKVIDFLLMQSVVGWRALVDDLLQKVRGVVEGMLATSIDAQLAARAKTQLYKQTYQLVNTFGSSLFDTQVQCVKHIVDCELHKPITYSETLLFDMKNQKLDKLQGFRDKQRVIEYVEQQDARNHKSTSRAERERDHMKYIGLCGSDEYKREVEAMATPLAFYDIASANLVDTLAKQLQFGLLHQLETSLHNVLFIGLHATDEAHCTFLLAEDPAREAQRIALLGERQKLATALEELEAFPPRASVIE